MTAATPVIAQVTVDLRALQALPERSAATHPSRPTSSVAPNVPTVATREAPAARQAAPAPTPQPTMPDSVPDTATIAPIAPSEPVPGTPPSLPPSVSDKVATATTPPLPPSGSDRAATAAAPTQAGLRLAFAPGQSDLSPESSASIKQLTDAAPQGDATTFNVQAYALGKPDDPSTARRVSLSRAMAVRSALVADGVPSARIFVRALGEQYGDGPPDRVDVNVMGANTQATTATSR